MQIIWIPLLLLHAKRTELRASASMPSWKAPAVESRGTKTLWEKKELKTEQSSGSRSCVFSKCMQGKALQKMDVSEEEKIEDKGKAELIAAGCRWRQTLLQIQHEVTCPD